MQFNLSDEQKRPNKDERKIVKHVSNWKTNCLFSFSGIFSNSNWMPTTSSWSIKPKGYGRIFSRASFILNIGIKFVTQCLLPMSSILFVIWSHFLDTRFTRDVKALFNNNIINCWIDTIILSIMNFYWQLRKNENIYYNSFAAMDEKKKSEMNQRSNRIETYSSSHGYVYSFPAWYSPSRHPQCSGNDCSCRITYCDVDCSAMTSQFNKTSKPHPASGRLVCTLPKGKHAQNHPEDGRGKSINRFCVLDGRKSSGNICMWMCVRSGWAVSEANIGGSAMASTSTRAIRI